MRSRALRPGLVLAAGACTVLFAGCTPDGTVPASTPSASVAEGVVPPAGQDWDVDSAQLMDLLEQVKADTAAQYQLNSPPDVDLIRFVSVDEWPQAQVSCLAENGIGASVGTQGGITFDDVPAEQGEAQRVAAYICSVEYAVDPRTQQKLPRVRAELQYQHLVDVVLPCVREQGYDVSQPPSLQTWLGQYYGGGEFWDPFAEAGTGDGVSSTVLDGLYESCEHDAPDLYPPVGS